ncbi:uncharacterized protein LOC125230587 [Leguminivora glycinivorella]|uniref:uncharacterized protein LOC125230587 n=1 Tax=Leguminivora glycinivorella TaxID=1035111 RepID=UPI00200DAE61|nr:uncharacterized protein LOC125230587 [Leguminivora glycinivorella]
MQCLGCQLTVIATEALACNICKGIYHYKCVCISSEYYNAHLQQLNKTWQCPSCGNVTSRRKGADGTPVRGVQPTPREIMNVSLLNDLRGGQHDDTTCQADMSCDESLLDLTNTLDNTNVTLPDRSKTSLPPVADLHGTISYNIFSKLLDSKLNACKEEINNSISHATEELRKNFSLTTDAILAEMATLRTHVGTLSQKVDLLEKENISLKLELDSAKKVNAGSDNSALLQDTISTITRIQEDLNERDQQALLNDIEITAVPEFKGESPMHIFVGIASKLGLNLEEHDVVHVGRVGPVHGDGDRLEGAGSVRSRPRPIVVRLARRSVRDQLLKNSRVRRGTTCADLGLPEHQHRPFYVNERLTKTNRILFGKARELKRAQNWRFVWTKDGRVFARKSETSKVHYIRSERDLCRVFEVEPTSDCSK